MIYLHSQRHVVRSPLGVIVTVGDLPHLGQTTVILLLSLPLSQNSFKAFLASWRCSSVISIINLLTNNLKAVNICTPYIYTDCNCLILRYNTVAMILRPIHMHKFQQQKHECCHTTVPYPRKRFLGFEMTVLPYSIF